MILTFKIKHNRDFTEELKKAKKIAEIAIQTKSRSSKDVKHIGLKSTIANQILRKYSKDKKAKRVKHVKLCIPNQGIHVDKIKKVINVPCLKMILNYEFRNDFKKINQIEVGPVYVYISISVDEISERSVCNFIGVDLNTTGHCAVIGNPETGKVVKIGKNANHIHKKYSYIRRSLQKHGKYKLVKKIKNRESRIIRDLNHKISRKIIDEDQ